MVAGSAGQVRHGIAGGAGASGVQAQTWHSFGSPPIGTHPASQVKPGPASTGTLASGGSPLSRSMIPPSRRPPSVPLSPAIPASETGPSVWPQPAHARRSAGRGGQSERGCDSWRLRGERCPIPKRCGGGSDLREEFRASRTPRGSANRPEGRFRNPQGVGPPACKPLREPPGGRVTALKAGSGTPQGGQTGGLGDRALFRRALNRASRVRRPGPFVTKSGWRASSREQLASCSPFPHRRRQVRADEQPETD